MTYNQPVGVGGMLKWCPRSPGQIDGRSTRLQGAYGVPLRGQSEAASKGRPAQAKKEMSSGCFKADIENGRSCPATIVAEGGSYAPCCGHICSSTGTRSCGKVSFAMYASARPCIYVGEQAARTRSSGRTSVTHELRGVFSAFEMSALVGSRLCVTVMLMHTETNMAGLWALQDRRDLMD